MTKIFVGGVHVIKIIFSDMDGTLLTSEGKLPEGFNKIIAELKKRGVIFSPASGRQYFALLKSFNQYEDEFIFLAEGGAFVMRSGEEIYSQAMPKKIALEVIHAGDSMKNILKVFCGKNDAYILDNQNIPEFTAELTKYYTHHRTTKNWEEIDDAPLKIAFFDPSGNSRINIYEKLLYFEPEVQVIPSSNNWVDVMMPNVNKGHAIKKIQQLLNIEPEECAAFGDYLNDYEMFKSVGYSFAMANAHPELKKIANFETLSNDEGGVLGGIKKLMDMGLV